jgi:hypothetical protein
MAKQQRSFSFTDPSPSAPCYRRLRNSGESIYIERRTLPRLSARDIRDQVLALIESLCTKGFARYSLTLTPIFFANTPEVLDTCCRWSWRWVDCSASMRIRLCEFCYSRIQFCYSRIPVNGSTPAALQSFESWNPHYSFYIQLCTFTERSWSPAILCHWIF